MPPPPRRSIRWAVLLAAAQLAALALHFALAAQPGRHALDQLLPASPPPPATALLPPEARCAKLQSTRWQAPNPEPDPGGPQENLLRTWIRVLVGGRQPEVLLALNREEAALSVDDGLTWSRHSLGQVAADGPPPAVMVGDGSALLALGPRTWMRLAGSESQLLTAPFAEPILQWISVGASVVALVDDESELPFLRYSLDSGASWHRGPNAPRGAQELAILDERQIAISYAWDVSCGGGDEGVVSYRLGDVNWQETPQHALGHLGASLWVLSDGCNGSDNVLCAWPPGPDPKPALGPSLPKGAAWQWFASNRETSFVGGGGAVYRVRGGQFTLLSEDAPRELDSVVMSDMGQLVGIANGHVVRWSEKTGWRVHLP